MNGPTPFWEKPLASLDRAEWEALCDGCGRCCVHKVEDEDTGRIYTTNVACKLLDRRNGRCTDYAHRKLRVADCVTLARGTVAEIDWLPDTCAYRLRAAGEPLREWHYLKSGDRESVHQAGQSTRGWTVSEEDAGELEWHVVERAL
ncbi:MAG: YcgN family cysteine cluster protein [Sphingomicrobium sp.]